MKKKITRIILALVVASFVSGAVVTPALTQVFAAEQTNQGQENPPSDAPQGDHDEHSGHHM